jgi:hypothetical protein
MTDNDIARHVLRELTWYNKEKFALMQLSVNDLSQTSEIGALYKSLGVQGSYRRLGACSIMKVVF